MILRAKNISKRYARKTKAANFFYSVQETDFILKKNSLVEIYGKSGSGKSTFLNMMCGILTPSSGNLLLEDENASLDLYSLEDDERSRVRNQHFAIIPQGQSALSALTVLENVKLPSLIYGEDTKELNGRALYLLEKLCIADLRNEFPSSLSGGELRRMAIARALVNKADFVFADEPTSDLDDENTENVLSFLQKTAENGTGILLVTHETTAKNYADKVFKMDSGVLKEER